MQREVVGERMETKLEMTHHTVYGKNPAPVDK